MSFSSQALLNEAFKMTTDYLSKKTLGRDEELQMLSCSYANLFLLAASKASMNEIGSAHELIAKCFERLGDTVWSEKHKVTAAGYFKLLDNEACGRDMQGGLDLDLMPQSLAVCRLQPNDGIPTWIQKSDFFSVTRSNDELSIVCTDVGIPDSVRSEKGWRCLKVKGPLDFSLTGVLASLVTPLSTAKVSIFTISTFDTDYLLIKNNDLENARLTLSNAGHRIDDSKK